MKHIFLAHHRQNHLIDSKETKPYMLIFSKNNASHIQSDDCFKKENLSAKHKDSIKREDPLLKSSLPNPLAKSKCDLKHRTT